MGLLCIIDSEVNRPEADAIASAMGYADYNVIIGGCNQAADFLSKNVKFVPTHVYVDIGARGLEVLNEIDNLAEYCIETTKVVVVGNTNDLNLYRQLIARGVTEYFVKPLNLSEIRDVLMKQKVETTKAPGAADGKIISFMAAASGDGATTVALNVGYQLAKEYGHRTVILDLDYQYGMVARNLDLVANYGVKELYEHPEGSIDLTMVEKTVTPYKDNLFVIAAPKALRYAPSVTPASIANILETLRMRFKYVIIDLPHVWNEMTVGVLKEVDHNMLVAQLWLKSATHASRLLDCMQFMGVSLNKSRRS